MSITQSSTLACAEHKVNTNCNGFTLIFGNYRKKTDEIKYQELGTRT